MNSCYIDRLPDDILCMIFKLISEEDQSIFHESSQKVRDDMYWDDWAGGLGDDSDYYATGFPHDDSDFALSALLLVVAVCERWKSVLSQIPSIWTTLQISFREGAASLEHVRTFLRLSGTNPLKITLLWDDLCWNMPPDEGGRGMELEAPAVRKGIVAGTHLVLVIQELYAHVHRWREFMLRTTSTVHMYQALSLMTRPSVHPAGILEKLHLQLVHNENHATHHIDEPSLFPGSSPPIRDLMLFGINWAWLSPSKALSLHLVNLRMHFVSRTNDDGDRLHLNVEALSQLLGGLPNLHSLSLELDIHNLSTMPSIVLPRLCSLAIASGSMEHWAPDFLRRARLPNLRILTLDGVWMDHSDLEGIIQELVRLTDPDSMEDSSSCLLELDELHLLNFTHYAEAALVHRLYKQLTTVKTLTLGELEWNRNFALTMGLLPTPYGLTGLPLPRLQKLILLDVPRDVVRRVVLERTSVACRLEELCHRALNEGEEVDRSVPNDWQHHVEKYHRIGPPQSSHYSDIVGRQWSEL